MKEQNDGGAAFPQTYETGGGMSLRDYFAAHALSGLACKHAGDVRPKEHAEDAYRIADAMIKARSNER